MSVIRKVANPSPAVLATINPKKQGGRKMAARKKTARKSRPKPRARAASHTSRPKRAPYKRNPSRGRKASTRSRSRARYARSRNPSGKVGSLILGAGLSQIIAAALPFNIGGVIGQAAKVALVGWGLEKFGGRAVPMLFGEAKEGGIIAAGVLLFNAYVAPTVSSVVGSVLPSGNGNGKGVNGIALTQYPFAPQLSAPVMPAATPQKRGVNGMATAAYPFR